MPQHSSLHLDQISLGRFVIDRQYPSDDFYNPVSDIPVKTIVKKLNQCTESESDAEADGIGARLLSFLSFKRSEEMRKKVDVSSDVVTFYKMENYRAWFMDVIGREKNREWLESAANSEEVYLVVEYQTVLNARVKERREDGNQIEVRGQVPVSEALGAVSGMTMLPLNAFNPSFNASRARDASDRIDYREEGEAVFAVRYRKLKFKSRSSGDVKGMKLGPNIWKRYSAYLAEPATDDFLEVELEKEEEEEGEEKKDGEI